MSIKSILKSILFFLLVLCLSESNLMFGISAFEPVAEEVIMGNGISWAPKISYRQIILTVSRPDGTVVTKTFSSGSIPFIDLSTIHGDTACDGTYTYELSVVTDQAPKIRTEKENLYPVRVASKSETPIIQTGHFSVAGGNIISKNGTEESFIAADVVHTDDTMITGSLCVGFDCLTDGTESFGFDTIRLKENNLQIHFEDTSTTAGFPANDWRIITNDSSSGGANYFKIVDVTGNKTPFKIEAGAKDSALYVNSSGRVGIGTSTPVLNIHVKHGDTPSLRLDQDTSSGWTAQVWDVSGNESNFFIRDTTGGSKLPFRIQPGTPTNTITMKNTGYVGIGTWSPGFPLEIETTGTNASMVVQRTDGATNYINATDAYANFGSTTNHPVRIMVNSTWKMRINTDNSLAMSNGASLTVGGTWLDASSRSLKENIHNLSADQALDTLANLTPVTYNYKADKQEKHVGFIAEDVPELVASIDRKGMSPMDIVAVLTKVVQEQQKTIDELKEKIARLEKK